MKKRFSDIYFRLKKNFEVIQKKETDNNEQQEVYKTYMW